MIECGPTPRDPHARYATVLAGMQASPDPTSLLLAVQELEEILADNAVIIPLYVRPNFELYRSDLIGGYGYEYWSFFPSSAFWNVDRWWRKDLEG